MTLRSVNGDDEIKAIMEVEPLKFYVTSLTVRITATENLHKSCYLWRLVYGFGSGI